MRHGCVTKWPNGCWRWRRLRRWLLHLTHRRCRCWTAFSPPRAFRPRSSNFSPPPVCSSHLKVNQWHQKFSLKIDFSENSYRRMNSWLHRFSTKNISMESNVLLTVFDGNAFFVQFVNLPPCQLLRVSFTLTVPSPPLKSRRWSSSFCSKCAGRSYQSPPTTFFTQLSIDCDWASSRLTLSAVGRVSSSIYRVWTSRYSHFSPPSSLLHALLWGKFDTLPK